MSNRNVFTIEWEGFEDLRKEFKGMEKKFDRILLEEMTKFGLLVEEGTKALAPKDTGDLEDSISFDRAKKQGFEYTVEGGSNLKYALRRHEEPYRMGTHPKYDDGSRFDNYYVGGRGRRTSRKTNWRGYRPGRKYLLNAVTATEEDWNKMLERVLERMMGGMS